MLRILKIFLPGIRSGNPVILLQQLFGLVDKSRGIIHIQLLQNLRHPVQYLILCGWVCRNQVICQLLPYSCSLRRILLLLQLLPYGLKARLEYFLVIFPSGTEIIGFIILMLLCKGIEKCPKLMRTDKEVILRTFPGKTLLCLLLGKPCQTDKILL